MHASFRLYCEFQIGEVGVRFVLVRGGDLKSDLEFRISTPSPHAVMREPIPAVQAWLKSYCHMYMYCTIRMYCLLTIFSSYKWLVAIQSLS